MDIKSAFVANKKLLFFGVIPLFLVIICIFGYLSWATGEGKPLATVNKIDVTLPDTASKEVKSDKIDIYSQPAENLNEDAFGVGAKLTSALPSLDEKESHARELESSSNNAAKQINDKPILMDDILKQQDLGAQPKSAAGNSYQLADLPDYHERVPASQPPGQIDQPKKEVGFSPSLALGGNKKQAQSQAGNNKTTIKAIFQSEVLIADGVEVFLRLTNEVEIDNTRLRRNLVIAGIATIGQNYRMSITLPGEALDPKLAGNVFKVYDTDGMEGILIPRSVGRDQLKASATNAVNQSTSAVSGYLGSAGQVINSAVQGITGRNGEQRIVIPSGYKVTLHN